MPVVPSATFDQCLHIDLVQAIFADLEHLNYLVQGIFSGKSPSSIFRFGSEAVYCSAQIQGPLSGAVPPIYKADVQITESNSRFQDTAVVQTV